VTTGRGAGPAVRPAPRVRLRPSVEVVPCRSGDVLLLRTGGAPAIVVREPDERDRELLRRLTAEAGVAAPEGSEVAARLEPLAAQGLLIDAPREQRLPPDAEARFARQLPWLAEGGAPRAAQRRLLDAHVVLLGCGGLGTWTLTALASLGIGTFTIADDDVVSLDNLNRQILYGVADVGRVKVHRAAAWLRRFDPGIRVRAVRRRVSGPQDVAELLGGADLLVLAADWPPYELGRWVNAACIDAGVPFMLAGQQPPLLKVGPTYVPGRGPCFACHERRVAEQAPLYPELVAHRQAATRPAVTLGPSSGVVGTLLALEVLSLLTSAGPTATHGRAMLLDMRTLEQRWEAVERDPECPSCGPAAGTVRPAHGPAADA
jgi:molybdopterin-synthase adenylyltransferase